MIHENELEIDEFLDGAYDRTGEDPETRKTRGISVLASILAFALVVTVVPAALAVPLAYTVKAAADDAAEVWGAVPSELPEIPSSLPGFTVLYDADGGVIAQFYAENRTPVTVDQVSPFLIDAIVDVEDRRFWEHHGVDGASVVRAAQINIAAGSIEQGASTLTQQLVENLKLIEAETGEERTEARAQSFGGKVVEAKTALELEEQLSKEEILEAYMNIVYFGAGSYGVAAAANRFFGVDVADLTLPQAALIAGMVREPSGLDPFANPERARNRRDTVLASMLDVGTISQGQFDASIAADLDTSEGERPENGCTRSDYPFYCEIVRDKLLDDPRLGRTQAQRDSAFYQGRLAVYTALDPSVMKSVDESIAKALDDDNRVATSVVVVEPGTGLVVAVGQNREWGTGEGQTEIPYALSGFQPGSSFKPTVLAAALEQGVNPYSTMPTGSGFKPSGFDYPSGGFDNYAKANYGTINAYDATRLSSNVWYTRLITKAGVPESVQMAKDMGVRESLNGASVSRRSAAFALGAWEVQPLEMASIYATIAAAGSSCDPVFITDIVNTLEDESLTTQRSACETAYSPATADALMDVVQMPFTSGGTAENFPLRGREAVGKTGTTNDHAAAWFVGATPQYATAVWVGDPRGGQAHPLYNVTAYGGHYARVFGADISGPLWNDVMSSIHKGIPAVDFSEVTQAPVSPKALTDLVPDPDVSGMSVLQAVSFLDSLGYSVTVDTETSPAVGADYVAGLVMDATYATLRVGNGSDTSLLGEEVSSQDGVLVVKGGR